MAASRPVRFLLDGQVVEVADAAPTTTLLQCLRERLGRTGTKEGCAEGDCGACTVALGELAGDRVEYRAINSCIRFLPTIDGKEIVTAESLQAADGTLHPVQQAMVDCHASQCGFCTPGFVMSLFALYLERKEPTSAEVIDALSGNLCRCTGYRPIVEAGCRMGSYPEPSRWSRDAPGEPDRVAALRALKDATPLVLPRFHAPRTADAFAAAYAAQPDSLILAGATDIGLWVTKALRELPPMLYVGEVEEWKRVREDATHTHIPAAVSLADGYAALVRRYPMLKELADRFASPPVRHSGTLVGNVANGSPIGDSMPILIALGATVNLRRGEALRSLPMEALYVAYRKTALQPGEFVESVSVPHPVPGRLVGSYKVSKRIDQDISAVCAAFAVDVAAGKVTAARIAFGGMAATPKRAAQAEAALVGAAWNEAGIEPAMAALAKDFQPLSDMRASASYRARVAANLLKRFVLEQGGHAVTRVEAVTPA